MAGSIIEKLQHPQILMTRFAENGIFHLGLVASTFAVLTEEAATFGRHTALLDLAILFLLSIACVFCIDGLIQCRAAVALVRNDYIRPVRTALVGFSMVSLHIMLKIGLCGAPTGF